MALTAEAAVEEEEGLRGGGRQEPPGPPRQQQEPPRGAHRPWPGPALPPLAEIPSSLPPLEGGAPSGPPHGPTGEEEGEDTLAPSPPTPLGELPSVVPLADPHIFWAESNLQDGIPVAMSLQVAQRLGLVSASMYDAFLRNSTLRLQEDIRSTMTLYVNEKKRLQGQLQGLRRDVTELRPRGSSGREASGRGVNRRGTVRGRILLPRLEGRAEAEEKLKKLKENELSMGKDSKRGAKQPLPLEKKQPEEAHTVEKVVKLKGGKEAESGPVSARTKISDAPSFFKEKDGADSARDGSKAVSKAGTNKQRGGDRRSKTEGDRESELTDGEEDVYRPVVPPSLLHQHHHHPGGDDADSIFTARSTRSHRSKKMVRLLPALPPSRLPHWSSGLNIAEKRSADLDNQAYLTDSVDFSQTSLRIPEVQDPQRTEIFLPKGARGSNFRARRVTFGHKVPVPRLQLNSESDVETDNEGDGEPTSTQRSRNLTTIQEDEKGGAKGMLALPRIRHPRAAKFKEFHNNSSRRTGGGGRWSRSSSLNKSMGYDSDRTEFSEAVSMESHDTADWKSVYSGMTDPEKRTQALADILYAVRIRMMENEQSLHYGMRPESLDGSSVYTPRKISKRRPAMSVTSSQASGSSMDRRARRASSQQLQSYLRKMHKQRRLTDSLSREEYAALRSMLKHRPPQTPSVDVKG